MINITVADNHSLFLEYLRIVLNNNRKFSVIAATNNGQKLINSITAKKPDVVLMNDQLNELKGVNCIKYIKAIRPESKVIMMTNRYNDKDIFNFIKNGISGYIIKNGHTKELYAAVEKVYAGQAYISASAVPNFLQLFAQIAQSSEPPKKEAARVAQKFNQSEKEIIDQVRLGLTNKEIAAKLGLSAGTVKNYISRILGVLNLRDRTQLAIWSCQTKQN